MSWKKWSACLVLAAIPMNASAGGGIEGGKIDVKMEKVSGSDLPRVVVTAVIDAPADEIWALVSDCRKTGKLFEGVYGAKRHAHDADTSVCSSKFSMPFPFSDLSSKMKYRRSKDGDRRISAWKLVSGDFERSEGRWIVEPYESSSERTWVRYVSHAEPSIPVPGWLQEQGLRDTVPSGMKKLRALVTR